jgi:hypothetical protein
VSMAGPIIRVAQFELWSALIAERSAGPEIAVSSSIGRTRGISASGSRNAASIP